MVYALVCNESLSQPVADFLLHWYDSFVHVVKATKECEVVFKLTLRVTYSVISSNSTAINGGPIKLYM